LKDEQASFTLYPGCSSFFRQHAQGLPIGRRGAFDHAGVQTPGWRYPVHSWHLPCNVGQRGALQVYEAALNNVSTSIFSGRTGERLLSVDQSLSEDGLP